MECFGHSLCYFFLSTLILVCVCLLFSSLFAVGSSSRKRFEHTTNNIQNDFNAANITIDTTPNGISAKIKPAQLRK